MRVVGLDMFGPPSSAGEMATADAAYQSWGGIIKGMSVKNMDIPSRHLKME